MTVTLTFESIAALFVQISENRGGGGGGGGWLVSKKVIIFPTFFQYFSFSHKLIKHFVKYVGNSLVIVVCIQICTRDLSCQ